jgi:hypothetical protein
MKKRFTDIDKWKDPWFRKLSILHKALFEYLRDNCDQAGFWKVDIESAVFHLGSEFDKESFFAAMNQEKIRFIDHGIFWEIVGFVSFQFGELSHDCKAHRPIFSLQDSYRLKGYLKGIDSLMEIEIDKDKEMDKEKEREGFDQLLHFEIFFKEYPKQIERSKALSVYCVLAITKGTHERIMKALKNYRAHLDQENKESVWKKPKNPDKWLEGWMDWENWVPVFDETPEFKARMAKLGVTK